MFRKKMDVGRSAILLSLSFFLIFSMVNQIFVGFWLLLEAEIYFSEAICRSTSPEPKKINILIHLFKQKHRKKITNG